LLAAPFQSPREELFQRATSFQESLEEDLKREYKTSDVSSHPEFRKELLALLSTYYEDLLDLKGAASNMFACTYAIVLKEINLSPRLGGSDGSAGNSAASSVDTFLAWFPVTLHNSLMAWD